MKIDVPRFDGIDVSGWIFKIEKFFKFYNTSEDQNILIYSFEGPALSWFQWMHANGFIESWKVFLKVLNLRFGPSMYENYRTAFSKVEQHSSMTEYQTQFEDLSIKVHGLSEQVMISFFISGLKPEIKRELLIAQPQSLARLQQDKFKELKQYFKSSWQRSSSESIPSANSKPLACNSLQQSKSLSLPVKRLSPAKLKIRREKGLCYNCDEKYALGHKCKGNFFLLISEEK